MNTLINISFATLRMATAIIFVAMGGVLSQQVGLINIALEGLMLMGAFVAVIASFYSGSALVGVILAAMSGALLALVFAFFIIRFRTDLIVGGLAVNILALGLTAYLLVVLFNSRGAFAPEGLAGLKAVHIPLLAQIPVLGPILSGHGPLAYVSWVSVFLTYVFLYRTTIGLHLRAAGENSEAAKSVGIRVKNLQYLGLVLSGALSGLGGAQLSLGNVTLFSDNMTNGRGYMALAAVFFGAAYPLPTALACLLFGLFEAIQIRLQTTVAVPPQFPQMLPFAIIVVILTLVSLRKVRYA